ncbi:MAG: CapA family protein [Bacteroidetes bacterium]|nr:CapA family protein [Bacteroidota bacterium]
MKRITTTYVLILVFSFTVKANKNEFNFFLDDSTITATISFVGDLMCHSTQFKYAMQRDSTYNFKPVYRYIKDYLSQADLTVGNLETVFGGDSINYSGHPLFNSPDEYLSALKYAGFDLLITANNHSLDVGEYGIRRTIDQINKNEMFYSGTSLTKSERDSVKLIDLNGIKLSFLSYTYGTNGNIIPKGKEYLVNIINFNKIKNDIKRSKEKEADMIIVYYHFGDEYKREPSKYQKEVVDSTLKFGADIIIGSHTHAVQSIMIKKQKNKQSFIAYSLGNFISNQRWRYSNGGVILSIKIKKKLYNKSSSIVKVSYLPTYVFKGKTKHKYEFVIIPSTYYYTSPIYQFFSDSTFKEMIQSFEDTNEKLKNYKGLPVKNN